MPGLAVESWIWYGLTWLVVITRIVSQTMLRGSPKKLKLDDYLMVVIMLTDTILIITVNIISTTNSNRIDPHYPAFLTEEDIRERVFGSKMVVLGQQMQCITIWLTKACILLMYHRLTTTLRGNLVVKIVAGYVAFGFVLMEILYMCVWCRPFNQYWAVPPISTQCSAATKHLITNAVFNISSDGMIILIPMPIFLQSQLPIKKKLILVSVFALGAFTILSAILNKFHSFHDPFGPEWLFWYIRESSTAIIVANLPLTWTVFRRLLNLGSFNNCEHPSKSCTTKPHPAARSHFAHTRTRTRSYIKQASADDDDMRGSVEEIANIYDISLKIYQRHDVHISSEHAPEVKPSKWSSASPPHVHATTTVIKGGPPRSFFHDADVETYSTERAYPVVKVTPRV